jgi:tRNA(adenine34) deaminase
MFNEADNFWMQRAIQHAEASAKNAEVPVGAVLILNNEIIGESGNCPISTCDPSAHAEILAIRAGAKKMNNYRLIQTTLYVTLEPCMMCVGALVHARVKRVVFGAYDLKSGAVISVFKMAEEVKFNHKVKYEGGLLADKCGQVLTNFFQARR